MRIYKPRFKDRDTGEKRETQKWYIDFRDHRQIRRRIPAEPLSRCRTKMDAKRFGDMIEALVTARQYDRMLDKRLTKWLHGLPKRTLAKLVAFDLLERECAFGKGA